mgnify:CR=1 FL=1|tara:strand:- start:696 stop:1271 length:576 start_codon:yes stop_codon:yes gene_type:complete
MQQTLNNEHNLKIYQIYNRKDFIILGVIFSLFLALFILSFFSPGIAIISYLFFFGIFGYLFVFFFKRANEKLSLCLYLIEISPGVYEFREVYHTKDYVNGFDKNYLWTYKNKLVPIFDITNEDQFKIFTPYEKPIPIIKSINIARAKEQSSARRLFSPKKIKPVQVFQMLFFLVAGGGLIFGIHVLITGGN